MQYLRGWTALRNDPNWVRVLTMGSALILCGFFVPIVGPLLLQLVLTGWTTLILRRAVSGQDSPLPRLDFDFSYLGKLVEEGVKGWLAALLWRMPMTFVMFASICCMYVGMGVMVSGGMAAGGAAGGEAGAGLGGLAAMCGIFAMMFVYIGLIQIMQMPVHMAYIRAEITGDLNQAMRFKDVMDMTKLMFKELFFGQIVMTFISFGLVLGGELMCFIGLFPAMVVLNLIMTFWHAELYRVYLEKGGEPLPIGPLTVEGGDVPQVGSPPDGWNNPQQF